MAALTTKQSALRTSSLVKGAILNERTRTGLSRFTNPTLPIPQFNILMNAHNGMADSISALIGYVETLRSRIEELENGRG